MSVHFLSCRRTETEDSVTAGLSRRLALLLKLYALHPHWFVSIGSGTFQFRSRFEPKKLFCHETEFTFQIVPILVFLRIHPFARVFLSFRGSVYSRHSCSISFGPSSVSSVKKYCHMSTIFKPASIVWISSVRRTIVRICVHGPAKFYIICSAVLSQAPSGLSE